MSVLLLHVLVNPKLGSALYALALCQCSAATSQKCTWEVNRDASSAPCTVCRSSACFLLCQCSAKTFDEAAGNACRDVKFKALRKGVEHAHRDGRPGVKHQTPTLFLETLSCLATAAMSGHSCNVGPQLQCLATAAMSGHSCNVWPQLHCLAE